MMLLTLSLMSSASLFLLGLAVGSAAALLLTPVSGESLRSLIGERVDDGRRLVAVRARKARESVACVAEDVVTRVKAGTQALSEEGRRIDAAIQAGKQAYQGVPAKEAQGA